MTADPKAQARALHEKICSCDTPGTAALLDHIALILAAFAEVRREAIEEAARKACWLCALEIPFEEQPNAAPLLTFHYGSTATSDHESGFCDAVGIRALLEKP